MGKEPAKKTEEKKADDKKAEEKKPAAAPAEKKGAAAAPKSPRGASTEKAAPAKSPRGDKPAADKKKAADDKKKAGADKKKKDDESATPESSPEPSEDDDDAPARPSAAAAAPKTSARKAPVGAADPSKSVPDGSQVSMAVVPYGASADDELAARQEEIMLLLLEARLVLDKIVQVRYEREREELERRRLAELQDKKRAGKLSITEIQDILKNMPDEDDFDWVTEVQKIKKDLAVEIRRNHVLDRKVQKLDKRIGLIIRNRTAMDAYLNEKKEKKRKKGLEAMEPQFDLNKEPRKLELYQELFYLLQTEPRYLAKCVYLVQPEEMDTFLATTILTLYGDAFSPREEFLILRLFKLSIQNEVAKIKSLGDFLNANTVVPKMVITYNRRKLGAQYLRTTLNPVLKQVIEKSDLTLELHPTIIYQAMINEMEVRTGQKSNLERNISEDEAVKNPEVKAIMKKRLDVLTEICQSFLDAIINSMSNLPYGIRWICKTIGDIARARFGEAVDQDQILKVTGYFVYYRFINLAIVTPDAYKVVDRDLSAVVRKNLVVVGKVLQNLFNFRAFGDQSPEKYLRPLNAWIEKNKPTVEHYFASLVTVDEPEDYLQVTKYNELTQRTKPVIMISTQEITNTHKLLIDNLEQLAPEKDDELRTILTDLGECPPQIDAESVQNREIQLTLTARFKVDVDDDDETERLYAETKEMIIPILRTIPIETTIHRLHLTDVLESGIRYATEKKNTDLSERIEKVLESIAKLEKAGKVSKADRYQQLVSDIGKEVANRNAVREQQKREIQRLRGTLEEMRTHQKYANEQLEQYKEYLKNAREMHQQQAQGKKKKKDKGGKEVKAKYKDLEKAGVIRDSEVPKLLRGKTTFIISTEDFSSYEVTAKLAGQEASLTIELDELLELHYNSTEVYEVSQPQQISLDVNMLIFYINRNFLASKKK